MNEPQKAAENLRVIRDLMARATIYRALSAPIALAGGVLTLLTGGMLMAFGRSHASPDLLFVGVWMVVLIIVSALNFFLMWKVDGHSAFSAPTFKAAMRAIIPPMLAGGCIGIPMALLHGSALGSALWVVFYGLALLSTSSFAPRSIRYLGAGFIISGVLIFWSQVMSVSGARESSVETGCYIMMATFGFFHLIYGSYVAIRKRPLQNHDAG